jgi:hypothetical protein
MAAITLPTALPYVRRSVRSEPVQITLTGTVPILPSVHSAVDTVCVGGSGTAAADLIAKPDIYFAEWSGPVGVACAAAIPVPARIRNAVVTVCLRWTSAALSGVRAAPDISSTVRLLPV